MTDSNEQERLALYGTAADSEEWGEPLEAEGPRKRLGAMVSVRLSNSELQLTRGAAKRKGLSLSAFVRESAVGAATNVYRSATVSHGSSQAFVGSMTVEVLTQSPQPLGSLATVLSDPTGGSWVYEVPALGANAS